jgi:hypothetical protein
MIALEVDKDDFTYMVLHMRHVTIELNVRRDIELLMI